MKKILFFVAAAMLLIPSLANAQDDWANINRYAKDNAAVTVTPKAVFMGDSITDGWPGNDSEFFTFQKGRYSTSP